QALAAYRRTTSTDEAGFAKEVRASIAKVQRAGLLDEQGDDYEVSPVLRLMIGPDTGREFIALYREAGATGLEDPRDGSGPEQDDEAEGDAAEGGGDCPVGRPGVSHPHGTASPGRSAASRRGARTVIWVASSAVPRA